MSDTNVRALPEIGFLRARDLVRDPKHPERVPIFPWGKTKLWQKIKDGEFPPPVRLGPNMVGWSLATIRAEVQRLELLGQREAA